MTIDVPSAPTVATQPAATKSLGAIKRVPSAPTTQPAASPVNPPGVSPPTPAVRPPTSPPKVNTNLAGLEKTKSFLGTQAGILTLVAGAGGVAALIALLAKKK